MERGVCLVISQLINSFQREGEGLNSPLLVSPANDERQVPVGHIVSD